MKEDFYLAVKNSQFKEDLQKVWSLAREFYEGSDPHGVEHVRRVFALTQFILEKEGGDETVVYPAVLLHDVGRKVSIGRNHSKKSAEIALEILRKIKYPENKIDLIIKAILEHSFSAGMRPSFKESKILSDADKLDALGAIGIARVFMESALRKRGIREAKKHFYEKILKLPNLMETETGKQLAWERLTITKIFLEELEKEVKLVRELFSHSDYNTCEKSESYGQHG